MRKPHQMLRSLGKCGLNVETSGGPAIEHFGIDTGAGSFVVSMRVAVSISSQNEFDAGFMFGIIGNQTNTFFFDRANSLFIDPVGIGFMDNALIAHSLDATLFHEYAIEFNSDLMNIFVDESFDDILNNAATPVLSRSIDSNVFFRGDQIQDFFEGVITFGDHTNDPFVNSTYSLDFVKIESLGAREERNPPPVDPIPEPATLSLLASGIAVTGFMGWRRRKSG